MKTLFKMLLCTIATLPIYSQNNLTGTIKDADTETPLAFVNVYLPELEKGSSTNEDGSFLIQKIPNGSYEIIFSTIGYKTLSIKINLPEQTHLDVAMYSSAIEMEEVILSTPFHKLQRDNVMKVEQKKVSEIRSKGAVTLAEGITNIQGVNSFSTGISIGKPVIRGLSGNRVLIYAQGVRLENQQFGSEHGLGLNDSGVESVEVIKGPASLLYGSDALGGVLYLNPERFANNNELKFDAGTNYFSNTHGSSSSLGLKQSKDDFKFLVRGSITTHGDYDTDEYRLSNTRFKEQDVKLGIAQDWTNFKTELRYNLNHSELGIPEELGDQNTNRSPLLPFQEITNQIFSSKSKWLLKDSSIDINLGYTVNSRKEFEEHHHHEDEDHEDEDDHDDEEHDEEDHDEDQQLDPALHMKLKTFSYDIKYNLKPSGRFETIVGIQGMTQDNENFGEETLIPDARTNDFGVLATSHVHFDNLDLQLGVRYDNRNIQVDEGIERDFNSFNLSAGLKTNIFKTISTRINLATGFRAPNLAELTSDGAHEGTNRYEIGDPDLNNEQNIQFDLALEYGSDHFEVFANGFYNSVSDYIFLSPNGQFIDEDAVFLYLQEDAKLYGGEFSVHIHPHPLDWLHIESGFETVIGELDSGDDLPLIPANRITNTVRVEFETKGIKQGNAFLTLNNVLDQDNVSINELRTGGYSLINLGISGTVKLFKHSLEINATANNIADKKYVSHLSRLKPDGLYNIGRNFSFGLRFVM
jgi:iron complex outermembrane receptor protein